MTPLDYLSAVRGVADHLEQSQLPAIEAAANAIVEGLRQGGVVYCSHVGHGIEGDFVNRAGGLIAVQRFSHGLHLNQPVPKCRRKAEKAAGAQPDRAIEGIRAAVGASSLGPADAILVGSVSGRNTTPVELALACRERGVTVIALTSMAYTAKVESVHPSGKKLCEAANIVVDIGAPYGDAAVEVAGYDIKLMPVSGVAAAAAGWMIFGAVLEKMAAGGTPASVLLSANRDGGPEYNRTSHERYDEQGY